MLDTDRLTIYCRDCDNELNIVWGEYKKLAPHVGDFYFFGGWLCQCGSRETRVARQAETVTCPSS